MPANLIRQVLSALDPTFSLAAYSAIANNNLCIYCSALDISIIATPTGQCHAISFRALQRTATICPLCNLFYLAFCSQSGRFQRPQDLDTGSALVCHLILQRGVSSLGLAFAGEPVSRKNMSVDIRVFAREGDAAQRYGVNIMRALSWTGSDRSMQKARQWIADCVQNHECSRILPLLGGRQLENFCPSRLIRLIRSDTGAESHVVVISPGQRCQYTTLSYCWGVHDETPWCTTTRNLGNSLNLDRLPRTIQDAVLITKKLGYDFLWVDALCILQDSTADWERESALMGLIYANSSVTIAATSSTSSTSGIFNTHSTSQADDMMLLQIPQGVSDQQSNRLSVFQWTDGNTKEEQQSPYQLREGPLSERAWSYLERLFSPRTLHYSSDQLFWECRKRYLAEDGLYVQPFADFSALADNDYTVSRELGTLIRIPPGKPAFEVIFWWYQSVLTEYTRRLLTRSTDKLPAVSAIAKVVHEATGAVYLAGIWLPVIHFGLCWQAKAPGTRPEEYRCPSYSWAACDAEIEWPMSIFEFDIPPPADFIVVAHNVESQSSDPFGSVGSGYLHLYGQIKPARVIPKEDEVALTCDEDSEGRTDSEDLADFDDFWTEAGGVPKGMSSMMNALQKIPILTFTAFCCAQYKRKYLTPFGRRTCYSSSQPEMKMNTGG